MCGIVLPNGRDCPGYVRPDSRFNVCAEHVTAIYAWGRELDQEHRKPLTCRYCGQPTAHRGIRGWMCGSCYASSPDYHGPGLSGAEMDTVVRLAEAATAADAKHDPHHRPIVYYIRFGDRIKIGTSASFRKRLESLPYDEVLGIELGGVALEGRRHAQFKAERITGEWFKASPRLVLHARSLMDDGATWQERLRGWKRPA